MSERKESEEALVYENCPMFHRGCKDQKTNPTTRRETLRKSRSTRKERGVTVLNADNIQFFATRTINL